MRATSYGPHVRSADFNMRLAQLLPDTSQGERGADPARWSSAEGDDLPDVLFPGEEHEHPVNAGSHARMGRRAELEGVVEGGEFVLQILPRYTR